MIREEKVFLEFQNIIDQPPVTPGALQQQACSNDAVTIQSWRKIWIDQFKANHAAANGFADNSIAQFHNRFKNMPCIIAGSGPSLRHNVHKLKDRGDMGLISCLHNFHLMEDHDANVDFYVTLDAGPITIEEVTEGGNRSAEYYWERTADKVLLAFVGTHPELIKKWRGKVAFYNAPIPDPEYQKAVEAIEVFDLNVSNGGNVLGSCLYIAKAFMGANPIIFVGADFSFGYDRRFHAWDSKYDKEMGYIVKATDVFGNKVNTWQSYANFKCWFDRTCMVVPGYWINATEGGCLGAYPEGNIRAIHQKTLDQVFEEFNISQHPEIISQIGNSGNPSKVILF